MNDESGYFYWVIVMLLSRLNLTISPSLGFYITYIIINIILSIIVIHYIIISPDRLEDHVIT